MKNPITFKNIVTVFKFLNVVDPKTGSLSPPKILAWAISIGISVVMFSINDPDMDLGMFAGALMTLVGAFAAVYSLSVGKKVKIDTVEMEKEEEPEEPKDEEVKP